MLKEELDKAIRKGIKEIYLCMDSFKRLQLELNQVCFHPQPKSQYLAYKGIRITVV